MGPVLEKITRPFWGDCLISVRSEGSEIGKVVTVACIPHLIQNIINAALTFAGIVAVFFIIWGGYKYIRSGGDPKQAEGARQTLTYAILGLVLVFLAYFIIVFIATVTGVECIKVFGFDNCL